jgi:exodeoxyribonuclease-1
LAHDPRELLDLKPEQIRQRLFARKEDLPEGVKRLPLKSRHLNKSPMVVGTLRTLRPEMAQRWGLNLEQAMQHAELAAALPDLSGVWQAVYERDSTPKATDPEQDLYGGFVGDADRRRLQQLRVMPMHDAAWQRNTFDDERLNTLVFRYRARNFPDTLLPEEQEAWQAYCQQRLTEGLGGCLTLEQLFEQVDTLAEHASERGDERAEAILGAIYDYAESLTERW